MYAYGALLTNSINLLGYNDMLQYKREKILFVKNKPKWHNGPKTDSTSKMESQYYLQVK